MDRSRAHAIWGLAALVCMALVPGTASAAISLVQDVFVQSPGGTNETTRTATFSANVTAGNALVATISAKNGGSLNSVSGGGVTWIQAVTVQPTGGAQRLWIYYGTNSAGSAKSVTIQGSADFWALEVSEWSGVDNSAALVGTNSNVGATGCCPTSGNVTATSDAALLIGIESDSSGGASEWGFGDSPSSTALQPGSGTKYAPAAFTNHVHQASYKIVSPGTYGMSWQVSGINSQSWGAAVAAFKADSSFVTFQGSGAVTTTASANPVCALPAGILPNDIGIWHAISQDNNLHTYPGPVDWAKVTQVNQGAGFTHSWAWKRFSGGESGNVTVTIAGTKTKQCKVSLWRGVRSSGNPYGASTTNQGGSSGGTVIDPLPVSADPFNIIVALIGVTSSNSFSTLSGGSGVGAVIQGYRHFVGGGSKTTISMNFATATITTPGSADLGSVAISGADWMTYQIALVPGCPVVSDPTYVVANAQSGQGAKIYWSTGSSGNPVVILRKQNAAFGSETPDLPGTATQVYSGSTSPLPDPVADGSTYYYMVFSKNASACYSSGIGINVAPAAAAPQSSYATTAASLAPVALDPWSNIVVSGSNDDKLHGENDANGTMKFAPFITGGPIQARPAVAPAGFRTTSGAAVNIAYVTSQDGFLYAVDTSTGSQVWKACLNPSPSPCDQPLGNMLQGGAGVWLRAFSPLSGVASDLVMVGTRNTGTGSDTNNKVYAVNGETGLIVWTFPPAGTNMDIISSVPYLDYTNKTVWVTSRAGNGGTQHSVWKLDAATGTYAGGTGTPVVGTNVWDFGDIDSSPSPSYDGTFVYVGTNAGDLKAIRVIARDSKAAGTVESHTPSSSTAPCLCAGTGAIKGAPYWLSYNPVSGATKDKIIFSRDTTVHRVDFDGTVFTPIWTKTLTGTPSVSAPVDDYAVYDGVLHVYVGASDGKLHKLEVNNNGADQAQVPATAIPGTLGEPTINWDLGVIHVGGSDGHVYTFALPF